MKLNFLKDRELLDVLDWLEALVREAMIEEGYSTMEDRVSLEQSLVSYIAKMSIKSHWVEVGDSRFAIGVVGSFPKPLEVANYMFGRIEKLINLEDFLEWEDEDYSDDYEYPERDWDAEIKERREREMED